MADHIEVRTTKTGQKVYRVVVTVGYGRGAPRMVQHFRTMKEARAGREEMRKRAATGVVVPARMTVGDLLDRWLDDFIKPNRSPKTTYSYRSVVEHHLKPAIGGVQLRAVTPTTVADCWKRMRLEDVSDSVVHHAHAALRAAFTWAVDMEVLSRNPAAVGGAKPPRAKARAMQTISAAQMLGVLEKAQGTMLEVPVMLATATGARRGELMALRWGDVDLIAGTVHIAHSQQWVPGHRGEIGPTKTGRERTVDLPPFALDALRATKREQVCPAEAFLVEERDADRIGKAWRKLADSLGLEGLRLHDLRHSYATMLLEQGEDVKSVQEALGHTRATTTMDTYMHVTDRMRQRRAERLRAAFEVEPEHLGSTSNDNVTSLGEG